MTDAADAAMTCRICGNAADNRVFEAREMMFGTRETFDYVECAGCGSLQITEIPGDLGRHYPRSYFSYGTPSIHTRLSLRRWIDTRRVRWRLEGRGLLGRAFDAISKPLDYLGWVRALGLDTRSRILDVGCGSGKLVLRMALGGFEQVTGIDPELDADIDYPGGVHVRRLSLAEYADLCGEPHDLVMFHHSLEHMADPGAQLALARRLLHTTGRVLIRVPVADSLAWTRYREHWVQLDPPRHLHLFTRRGLGRLAQSNALAVESVRCDSTPFQFFGSELYSRDIALTAPGAEKDIFDAATLARFAADTARLNSEGKGDQAVFVLRPA